MYEIQARHIGASDIDWSTDYVDGGGNGNEFESREEALEGIAELRQIGDWSDMEFRVQEVR